MVRKAQVIVACFRKVLQMLRDYLHVKIWLDNCSAQNKNWNLFSACVEFVNCEEFAITDLELAYLCKGHTFMSADSANHGRHREGND